MSVSLDSDLLRTFLAVAEAGNVTRAAEGVGRTQSAVSMQIRRLEECIGAALFERGPRGVALTRRGDQLVPYARRVVGLLDETSAAMRSRPLDGPVRIGIPEEHSQKILPYALAAFAESHPAVEVTVRSDTSVRQLAALEKDDPLAKLDNVILTPHWLPSTLDAARLTMSEMAEGMIRAASGRVPANIVNAAVLDRPGFQAKLARFAT